MRLALIEVSLEQAIRLRQALAVLTRDDVFAVLSLDHTVKKIQGIASMLADNFEVLNIRDDSPDTICWYAQSWLRADDRAIRSRENYMVAMEERCGTIIVLLRNEEAKALQAIEYKRIFGQLP